MTKREISDAEHEHGVIVWKTFRIKYMKYYHHLYLKFDVLLSTDVFGIFRIESINFFESDPSHYLSTPGYSWDAILGFTDGGIRGGEDISMICKGCIKANNKFQISYDPSKLSTRILYLDANDLYEHPMIQKLISTIILIIS